MKQLIANLIDEDSWNNICTNHTVDKIFSILEIDGANKCSEKNAMFNIIEQLLDVQKHQVLNYLNEAMNDDERDKHGDNIMSYLVDAKQPLRISNCN